MASLPPVLVVAFAAPVYLLFSAGAAVWLERALGIHRGVWFLIYSVGALVTIVVIVLFLGRAAKVARGNGSKEEGPAGE